MEVGEGETILHTERRHNTDPSAPGAGLRNPVRRDRIYPMTHAWRRFRGRLLAAASLGLLGCDGGSEILAPPPAKHFDQDVERAPRLPPTVMDVPLLVDLGNVLRLLETALPRRFGDITKKQRIPDKKRAAFAFELSREPFLVSIHSDTIYVASTIHYQGRGWYNPPLAPEVSGSCGTGDIKPRARVVIAIRPTLDRQWRLHARARLARLDPLTRTERDQCEVTFIKINVTNRVIEAARGAIRSQLPKVDAELARMNVQQTFEPLWNEVQKPIKLADSVWLMLQPTGVRLGKVSGTSTMVGATVGITAQPKIETGPMPAVAYRPLPTLDTAGAATGLNLLIEGRFDYGVIAKGLTDGLAGQRIERAGGAIEISEVGVFGIGGGRLALGVRFIGTARGRLYFIGTPQYDSTTGRIAVPDLDYDASSAGLLVRSLGWLNADQIRDFLRTRATFPSTDALDRLSTLVTKGLNRDLTRGVHLSASITSTRALRIVPRADALYLQAHATGEAAVQITDDFFAKFLPQQRAARDSISGKPSTGNGPRTIK